MAGLENGVEDGQPSASPGVRRLARAQAFVKGNTGHASAVVLQAGVDLSLFKPQPKRATLTMVYHGRLDRHRGVLACAMLAQKAVWKGSPLT